MSDRPPSTGAGDSSAAPSPNLRPAPDAGTLAMYLFLAALTMFFATSVVGYLVIRRMHQPWPPPGFPTLPRSLWLSTLAILFSSWTVQQALKAIRGGNLRLAQRQLVATLVWGLMFLALQIYAWVQIVQQLNSLNLSGGPYMKLFYALTGLHAAHVIGGLGPLLLVIRRAFAGRYTAAYHPGIHYCALYWHFLDAVWCVLFAVVYLF